MEKIDKIRSILAEHREELKKKYKVKNIGIFGSYVKGKEAKESDVDILVEFTENIGLLEFIGLEYYLSDLIGVKVDLVMKTALRPRIGKRILKEVVYV